MKSCIISSKSLSPSRDNPAGRWDFAFHALSLVCVRLANGIAADPESYDMPRVLALVANERARLDLRRALENAPSRGAIYALLCEAMRLTDPSPEMRAGLENVAQRIAHENALRITREAFALLERAKALKQ